MEELDLSEPFIIENGGALMIPAGHLLQQGEIKGACQEIALSTDVAELADWLSSVIEAEGFRLQSMLDMSIQEIMEYTGLEPGEAERAKLRRYTIPLVWKDDPERLDDFAKLVQEQGWRLLKGGRFFHLQGQTDKSHAMQTCIQLYEEQGWGKVISIALGDSANDQGMLEKSDYAVVIPQKYGDYLKLSRKDGVFIASYPGPKGWNEGLLSILKLIQDNT
jgi:mannosyl-3-phosphoglycerate phosphatase